MIYQGLNDDARPKIKLPIIAAIVSAGYGKIAGVLTRGKGIIPNADKNFHDVHKVIHHAA